MKIACIGNMNNMLFSLTRYLRDRGYDAELLMHNNEFDHFFPDKDSYDLSYQKFCKQLDWGDVDSWKKRSSLSIKEDVAQYDFIIGTGPTPAFLNYVGISLDVFFPHGSDLFQFPFLEDRMRFDQKLRNKDLVEFYRGQIAGIQRAYCVNQEISKIQYRGPIIKLDVLDKVHYFGCPLVYSPIYGDTIQENYSKSKYYTLFQQLRDNNDILVVNQARHQWKNAAAIGQEGKGTDVLINGFADFVKSSSSSTLLVLFDYGIDVQTSKDLIQELGIEDKVLWLPKMSRSEIMILLSLADFVCGEFEPGCLGGGTTWEAFVSGSILLHYVDTDEVKFEHFDSPYPFVNAKNSDVIKAALDNFEKKDEVLLKLGLDGREWYNRNFSQRSVNEWINLIEIKGKDGVLGIQKYIAGKSKNKRTTGST